MRYLLLILVFFHIGCSEKKSIKVNTDSSFESVYEFSEMALLMEKMYEELKSNRNKIIDKTDIGEYPLEFNKIHTAQMTKGFTKDEEFNRLADLYIQNLSTLYTIEPEDPNRKEAFNNTVKSCITCHRSDAGCMGPVSRIGGLLIE